MIVTRIINGIEIDVDINERNLMYFDEVFSRDIIEGDKVEICEKIYKNEKHIPLEVIIELTNVCNFSCKFCYICNSSKVEYWDYNSIILLLDKLISKGILFCTLTGGECLCHPQFKEIYRYLKQHGVLVTVFSNLNLLTSEHIELFKEYPPYKMEISVYGMNLKDYNNVMFNGVIELNVLENILKLKREGINILCKTPVNVLTQQAFFNIKKWMEQNSIPYYYSSELLDSYSGESMQKYSITDSRVKDFLYNHESEITDFNKEEKVGYKNSFNCKAGKYSMYISYEGTIAPCMAFNELKEYTFKISENFELGYSKMINFIESYKGKRLKYCKGCKSHKACAECIFTQLKNYQNLKLYMEKMCRNM